MADLTMAIFTFFQSIQSLVNLLQLLAFTIGQPQKEFFGIRCFSLVNDIKGGADRVIGVVTEISSALARQTEASHGIGTHVETMVNTCEENSRAAEQTARSARSLEDLASTMRTAAGQFRI